MTECTLYEMFSTPLTTHSHLWPSPPPHLQSTHTPLHASRERTPSSVNSTTQTGVSFTDSSRRRAKRRSIACKQVILCLRAFFSFASSHSDMTSQFGMMDALQREFVQLSDEFAQFSQMAQEVLDCDRQIMRQMKTEAAFRSAFADWLRSVHGCEAAGLSASDRARLERAFSVHLMDRMRTRPFLQAQDHLRSRLQEDMQHLLSRIHRGDLPKDRSDQLVKGVLNISYNVHSVMSDFNQVMNFLNEAQGVHVLQPSSVLDDEDDDEYEFRPSDFGVPMFSQRVAVMEEIVSLQPQLERAINNGDVASASRLGGRVAGLQALLKQMAPPPQPRVIHLAITME